MDRLMAKKMTVEFLGTFVLVFVACGVAAATGCSGSPDAAYALTALAFGFVLVALAYAIGGVSGCHVNPAVSLGMWIAGRMTGREFALYAVSQFLGGIFGAALLVYLLGVESGLGANHLYDGDIAKTMLVESLLTFVFVLAVLGATERVENSAVAGIVAGLALALVHLFGIAFTGTSVNPARTLGPAIFVGWEAVFAFFCIAPATVLGGAVSGAFWRFVRKDPCDRIRVSESTEGPRRDEVLSDVLDRGFEAEPEAL